MKLRLLVAGATLAMATVPFATPAQAFVCAPEIRDACDTVCAHTIGVCRLFG